VGLFDGDRLELEVMHRFPNGPVAVFDSLHWDILYLWREIKEGLGRCARSLPSVDSVGVDAWAQDFGLLGVDDVLLGNPHCYRDPRTHGMIEEALRHVTAEDIYQTTGNPLIYAITTLCQLLSMVKADSPALREAQTFLNIADLINFWLTGRKACESTLLINGQCYDPVAKRWATELLEKLGIPAHIFGEIVGSGTVLGTLAPSVAEQTGLGPLPVVAPACHDSAAAVVAVPTREPDYLFLSCGTWSVLGTEIAEPFIRPEGPIAGLGNEGGAQDNVRLTTNILGLWLVQECRRVWAAEGEAYSYDELTQMAAQGRSLVSLVDPNDARFLAPGDMPGRVQAFCRETGQPVPDSRPDLLRCILESLALKYRQDRETIESALQREMKVVHMVGGGIRNRLLCQFTANAMNLPVLAGPVESTALGNMIMQAVGLGHLSSVQEGRDLVRASVSIETYEPDASAAARWQEASARFQAIA
jgi:rhamnulokinase